MGLLDMPSLPLLQFIKRVMLLQHEPIERTETISDEHGHDWEGGHIYVLGKKVCSVCHLGMLKILPSLGSGILPMQHIKELASFPTSLLLESLFNLAGVGSHASTLNLSSMREVLLLCHSFRSGTSTLSSWTGTVGILCYRLHNTFICQPSPCPIKVRDYPGPSNMNRPHSSFLPPAYHLK